MKKTWWKKLWLIKFIREALWTPMGMALVI
ncbi:hypothetical protein KAI37_02561 [Paenibacillus sp. S25]|nr:hypothetical protein KAI37_02561 [Paenibacillus sp. S25]